MCALVALILSQMPGTIVLTPTAVISASGCAALKAIQYNEVMSIQMIGAGRMTRVLGDNRVNITHTWNHSAAGSSGRSSNAAPENASSARD